jgi:L-ascorbate metabolism protein UlaG (beta-lactamase superfamily)
VGARLTHVGGPTVLIELGGWRLLTDPTFDPAGGSYRFGFGTGSRKVAGPALAPEDLGEIDAVLLSHDQHDDNLDTAGRAWLPAAGTVVTTAPGAGRLRDEGIADARGLEAWERTTLSAPGKEALTVTATPCRHGPPLSRPIVGAVAGFAVALASGGADGASSSPAGDSDRAGAPDHADVWISGDTVLYDGVREVGGRLASVDVALIHLGGVRFPISGPLRYTMDAAEAAELVAVVDPRVAVPIHYEGWAHFREPAARARGELSRPPFRWLEIGAPTDV